jgi:hypothetical protein
LLINGTDQVQVKILLTLIFYRFEYLDTESFG